MSVNKRPCMYIYVWNSLAQIIIFCKLYINWHILWILFHLSLIKSAYVKWFMLHYCYVFIHTTRYNFFVLNNCVKLRQIFVCVQLLLHCLLMSKRPANRLSQRSLLVIFMSSLGCCVVCVYHCYQRLWVLGENTRTYFCQW